MAPSTVTLLGPQDREPNLGAVLAAAGLLGGGGPYAVVTAGWQEREGELDALRAHLECEVHDLRVYARTEDIWSADRALRLAHRQRQAQLQEMQELYALRLGHAKAAARELFERHDGGGNDGAAPTLRRARRQAIAALRRLDREHLLAIRRVHESFERTLQPLERPAVRQTIAELQRDLAAAKLVLIAGGHVAALISRLRLLDAARLFAPRPIVAWSAGAMAVCEAIVLYHDHPPQGAANAEVLDAGLGLVHGIVALPHAQSRLALHDATRIALFARRFAPLACLTLDRGACLHYDSAGRLALHAGTFQLSRRGLLDALPPPGAHEAH